MSNVKASAELQASLAAKWGWNFEVAGNDERPTGRYEVGKKYLFFTYRSNNGVCCPVIPMVNLDHETLEMVVMECVEEHEVPVQYSDNTAKGYVFKAGDGRLYHNQYPIAEYGQVSTEGDYVVYDADPEGSRYGFYGLMDFGRMLYLYHHYNLKQVVENQPENEILQRNNAKVEQAIAEAKERFGLTIAICQFKIGNKENSPLHFRPRYTLTSSPT